MKKTQKQPTWQPLTQEEKQAQVKHFLAQKKEQYFQGCLFSLLSNPAICKEGGPNTESIITLADLLADKVLEKMFKPQTEE